MNIRPAQTLPSASASAGPSTSTAQSAAAGQSELTMQTTGQQQPAVQTATRCNHCGFVITTSEYSHCVCQNCGKKACTVDKCGRAFGLERTLRSHQNRDHADPHQCFACKTLKPPRGIETLRECPVCGIFWCLLDDCGNQFTSAVNVRIHQARAH